MMLIRYPIAALMLCTFAGNLVHAEMRSSAGDCQTGAEGTGSLSDTLDDCNGVLPAPRVGDGEIVEPAPNVGTMPVIDPKDLRRGAAEPDTPEGVSAPPAFKLGDIIASIAASTETGQRLQTWSAQHSLKFVDISVLFKGADRAALEASLELHREGVESVRTAFTENPVLAEKLAAVSIRPAAIVSVFIMEDGSGIVFARA